MKKKLHPESKMMSFGYKPSSAEGSVKPPIYMTSTFAFSSAEEGKAFFEQAYGINEDARTEDSGFIYSRISNPNLEMLEQRLCVWDNAGEGAVFSSGMAAISTALMTFLTPGDALLYSAPTYGGTDHFIKHILKAYGIVGIEFTASDDQVSILKRLKNVPPANRVKMIFVESPANPTNDIFDIRMCRAIADTLSTTTQPVHVVVDNTYMGPVWSNPISHGADLVVYSATKYISGHSDLIAGAVLGKKELIKEVKTMRTFLGNMASPHTCWMLLRSLETLKVRMDKQTANAQEVAAYLKSHPLVKEVLFLGNLPHSSVAYKRYKKQFSAPGAMVSFRIKGGEAEAFEFLNHLHVMKLAVSLGSNESLAQHPATMTHAGMDEVDKRKLGITDDLIRLSIGIEHPKDLIDDMAEAFNAVKAREEEELFV